MVTRHQTRQRASQSLEFGDLGVDPAQVMLGNRIVLAGRPLASATSPMFMTTSVAGGHSKDSRHWKVKGLHVVQDDFSSVTIASKVPPTSTPTRYRP